MMDKPFRTIEEQIAILNSRGVATDKWVRSQKVCLGVLFTTV